MDKEQATALANEGKKKATAIGMASKEKIASTWKSGRKGKAICIGGAVAVLLLLIKCWGCGGPKPFEVDAPVKSLCGFAIGATPSSVKPLFKNPTEGTDIMDGSHGVSGMLAEPFRHFDYANSRFDPALSLDGDRLSSVRLRISDLRQTPLETPEECFAEVEAIVAMLEKKYGIKFKKTKENRRDNIGDCLLWYEWKSEGGDDSVKQSISVCFSGNMFDLHFKSDFFSAKAEAAMKAKQKPAQLSSDAGADQL